jgi:hypothetical protein
MKYEKLKEFYNVTRFIYCDETNSFLTEPINKGKDIENYFDTYDQAVEYIETLPKGSYQIQKIFVPL